jgi:hypothetical protein
VTTRIRWLPSLLAAIALVACSRGRAQDSYARQVAEAVPMIEKSTGLRFKQPPKYEVRSKEQVRSFLEKQFADEKSARDLAAQQTVMRRLGIIPDTLDLRKLMLDLLTEQIVGFYDPKTKVLYLVSGAPEEQLGFVIQHELVHALQDQYMNLDSIQNIKGDDDRQLAAQSVMEGQATLVPIQAMLGAGSTFPGGWDRVRDLIRESQSSMPVMARTPEFIQEMLIFPYLNGAEFMRNFQAERPGRMPYGADMPTSSSQIVHKNDYFGDPRREPVRVTLPAPRGASLEYDNDMGEFPTRVFLYQLLKDQNEAARAAAGWAGDRYALLKTPQGDGLAWLTVFQTPVDAVEFAQAMQEVVAKRYPSAKGQKTASGMHFEGAGRTILVWGGTVAGQSAVLYLDVPAGAGTNIIDLSKVKLN